eukprot:g9585.t1
MALAVMAASSNKPASASKVKKAPQKMDSKKAFEIPGLQARPYHDDELQVAFEIIDLDRHGEIGATDLRRALQLCGEPEPTDAEIQEMIRLMDPDARINPATERLVCLFMTVNTEDGSGSIEFAEFRRYFVEPPPLFRNFDLHRRGGFGEAPDEEEEEEPPPPDTLALVDGGDATPALARLESRKKKFTLKEHAEGDPRAPYVKELAKHGITPEFIRDVYQTFVEIDTKDTGFMSFEAFCKVFSKKPSPEMREIFDAFDADREGELDLRQLPFVSYECASPDFSDTIAYPALARMGTVTTPGFLNTVQALKAQNDWKHLFVISGDPAYYQVEMESYTQSFQDMGFSVQTLSAYENRWNDIEGRMATVKGSTSGMERVILVLGSETFFRKLICASITQGLQSGIVWLSTGTWRGEWWKKTDLLTSAHRQWLREDVLGLQLKQAFAALKSAWDDYSPSVETTRQALIDLYVTDQKDELLSVEGTQKYHEVHVQYHPTYRKKLYDRGYYDIFFFNLEGDLIYSVFKETDYGTNFKASGSGPWKDSGVILAASAQNFRSFRRPIFASSPPARSRPYKAQELGRSMPGTWTASPAAWTKSVLVRPAHHLHLDSRMTHEAALLQKLQRCVQLATEYTLKRGFYEVEGEMPGYQKVYMEDVLSPSLKVRWFGPGNTQLPETKVDIGKALPPPLIVSDASCLDVVERLRSLESENTPGRASREIFVVTELFDFDPEGAARLGVASQRPHCMTLRTDLRRFLQHAASHMKRKRLTLQKKLGLRRGIDFFDVQHGFEEGFVSGSDTIYLL